MKNKQILRFLSIFILAQFSFLSPLSAQNTQEAIEKACLFLSKVQKKNGAICDTINPLFNVWETILASNALFEVKKDTNESTIKNALSYLRMNENPQDLICHNQKCREGYCLETTAEYFLLLWKMGEQEKVKSALQNVISLQKTTGDWDIGNPNVQIEKNFPSVTGFSLEMIQKAGLKPLYPEAATAWLLQRQNAEGHWGNTWEYYDCPAYALWAILRALQNDTSKNVMLAKQKAANYILQQQKEDGSWDFVANMGAKKTSAELQTALMLLALEYVSIDKKDVSVQKGVSFLLTHQQKNGSWDGGEFPIPSATYTKKEYIFATSAAILVLLHQK